MAVKADAYFGGLSKKLIKQEKEATLEILKDMKDDTDEFVPHDTGDTRFVDTSINIRKKAVIYENEYIEAIFWGVNRWGKVKFQKTNNPGASAKWTEKSIAKYGINWENKFADIIESAF